MNDPMNGSLEANAGRIQRWLEAMQAADPATCDELVTVICRRIARLARKMLGSGIAIHRWHHPCLFWNLVPRLNHYLRKKKPATLKSFVELASQQMRCELSTLASNNFERQGDGERAARWAIPWDGEGESVSESLGFPAMESTASRNLWIYFHHLPGQLPDQGREPFDLHWYFGFSLEETAGIAQVAVHVMEHRWQLARDMVHQLLISGDLDRLRLGPPL